MAAPRADVGPAEGSQQRPPTVVLGVIGADVHIIGTTVIEHALTAAGVKVINLGVMVQQAEFVDAAVESAADAILVSSTYGQGELDCLGLRERCDEAGLAGIPLLVGGNLVVGRRAWDEVEKTFLDMGYTRAYPPGTRPDAVVSAVMEVTGSGPAHGVAARRDQ